MAQEPTEQDLTDAHFQPQPEPAGDVPPPVIGAVLPAAGDGAPLDPRGEETIWTGRTHWQHYIGVVILAAIALIVFWIATAWFGSRSQWSGGTRFLVALLAAVVVMAGTAAIVLVKILQRRYRLTGQRLFIEKGILSQTIDQTELIRVDDVRVHKSLTDRFLGMGTIEILSTDATDRSVTIEGIKGPESVAEHIRSRMRTLRSKSLFVENL